MYTTIQKWGNSQAVRIPKSILEEISFKENEKVEILTDKDTIIIKKTVRKRYAKKSIEERLESFYQKPIDEILSNEALYSDKEYDWGASVGKEV